MEIYNKYKGDILVESYQTLTIYGSVKGNIKVEPYGTLIVYGSINGTTFTEEFATFELYGTILGQFIDYGCHLYIDPNADFSAIDPTFNLRGWIR